MPVIHISINRNTLRSVLFAICNPNFVHGTSDPGLVLINVDESYMRYMSITMLVLV